MKKIIIPLIIIYLPLSCSFFKPAMNIKDVIIVKEKIDGTQNPAQKFVLSETLKEESIKIENLLVKDISESSNVDYDFCVIADIQTEKGTVECFIYSRNTYIISRLEKGKSKINIRGYFGRFFSMLDQYYTKLEIIKADIEAIPEKK